jgi:hypothetical protein
LTFEELLGILKATLRQKLEKLDCGKIFQKPGFDILYQPVSLKFASLDLARGRWDSLRGQGTGPTYAGGEKRW